MYTVQCRRRVYSYIDANSYSNRGLALRRRAAAIDAGRVIGGGSGRSGACGRGGGRQQRVRT